jgi:hypothetical protein
LQEEEAKEDNNIGKALFIIDNFLHLVEMKKENLRSE